MTEPEDDLRDHYRAATERETLRGFLEFHRDALLRKVEGMSETDIRRVIVPSGWSLLNLVKHLAYVERWWFQAVFAGERVELGWSKEDPDADWRVASDEPTREVLDFYRGEVDRSRQIEAAAPSLDELPKRPKREETLRWIIVHMIEETARHNGHADVVRELIDGATGE
jgi:uncharacterized damage-inducible protein DinB